MSKILSYKVDNTEVNDRHVITLSAIVADAETAAKLASYIKTAEALIENLPPAQQSQVAAWRLTVRPFAPVVSILLFVIGAIGAVFAVLAPDFWGWLAPYVAGLWLGAWGVRKV